MLTGFLKIKLDMESIGSIFGVRNTENAVFNSFSRLPLMTLLKTFLFLHLIPNDMISLFVNFVSGAGNDGPVCLTMTP